MILMFVLSVSVSLIFLFYGEMLRCFGAEYNFPLAGWCVVMYVIAGVIFMLAVANLIRGIIRRISYGGGKSSKTAVRYTPPTRSFTKNRRK